MTASLPAENTSYRLSFRDLALALVIVLPLAAIIAPYRSVHLPQMFILGVALAGGFLCFKTAIEDVESLLVVFLLYVPFQKVLPGDFGRAATAVNFTNAILFLLLIGWLTRRAMAGEAPKRRRMTMLDFAVVLFLAITSVSIMAEAVRESGDMRYGILADLKNWLTPFAIYFFVAAVGRSTAVVKKMFLGIIVTTAVIGLLGVKQFWMDMGGGTRHNLEGIRIAVTSGPSNLGALFAYYLPFLIALWMCNFWRFRYWALLIPLTWCIDSLRTTFSRGAALALIAAALIMILRRNKLVFILVAIAAIMIGVQTKEIKLPYSIFGRMSNTYEADRPGDTMTDKLDTSARTRLIIWGGAVEMIRDHPFFGVGYGRFPDEIGKYRPEVTDMDPHNNFLKIGAELGIPGLVAFVILLFVCLWKGWRCYRRVDDPLLKAILLGYCGSVMALMIANIFGSRLDSTEITTQFWAITGGVVLIERYEITARKEADEEGEHAVA
jgi:O-antigen ligase